MIELLAQLYDVTARLEGATALNVLLLHRLGGQVTLTKHELISCNKDFQDVDYSSSGDQIVLKLASPNSPPNPAAKGAAQ